MKNLKIVSFNLGKKFVPVKYSNKREVVSKFLLDQDCDVILLQGEKIKYNIWLDSLKEKYLYVEKGKAMTLIKKEIQAFPENHLTGPNNVVFYSFRKPFVSVNVNYKKMSDMKDVLSICKNYSDPDSPFYVPNRIIGGRFPNEFHQEEFCDRLDLNDLSTSIAPHTHERNNRAMVNHLFISRNLSSDQVYKNVGIVEVSKIGEAYPIEAKIILQKTR